MTFFSGTDMATLKEQGKEQNHFVSLIINNEGSYTAAITRKVKYSRIIDESYSYGSFENTVIEDKRQYTQETEQVEFSYFDIEKEEISNEFKNIDERLKEIKERKKSKSISTSSSYFIPKTSIKDSESSLVDKIPYDKTSNIESYYEDIPPFTETGLNNKDVKSAVLQLITGSIIIKDESKIDLEKWVNSMPKIYEDRFGAGEEGFKDFANWADQYCEFLITDKEPPIEHYEEESLWLSQFASAMQKELKKLPKNIYMEEFINILEQWILQ